MAAALHQRRLGAGWKPLGRKIGFTNRSIWPRYGVFEPIWGMVYDRTLSFALDNFCGALHLILFMSKGPC